METVSHFVKQTKITTAQHQDVSVILDTLTYQAHVVFAAVTECTMRMFRSVSARNSSLWAVMDYAYVFQITFCMRADV
jgi:hypothetical protein